MTDTLALKCIPSNFADTWLSGNCIDSNEFILTDEGYIRGKEFITEKEQGFYPKKVGIYNLDNEVESTSHFYYNGISMALKFKTTNGYGITTTLNHPLLAFNYETLDWFKATDIGMLSSEYLCLSVGTELYPSEPLELENYFPTTDFYTKYGFNLPIKLDESLAKFMGMLVIDNYNTFNAEFKLPEDAENITVYRHKIFKNSFLRVFGDDFNMDSYYPMVKEFLEKLGVDDCDFGDQIVPWSILRSPKNVQEAFLSGMMDFAAGTSEDSSLLDGIILPSEQLAKQVQMIYLNMGKVSKYKWNYDGINNKFSYTFNFLDITPAQQFDKILEEEEIILCDKMKAVREQVIEKNYFLDKISYRGPEYYVETVAFTVPRTHSFVAKGLVTHDTSCISAESLCCENK